VRNVRAKLGEEIYKEIEGLLTGNKSVSRFMSDAAEEKIKRMLVRDKQARLQLYKKDLELLRPFIIDVLKETGLVK